MQNLKKLDRLSQKNGVMKSSIVDTNVILRYLLGDNPEQQAQARKWFKQAEENRRELLVTPIVIAEVSFILESFYKKNREEIADVLLVLVSQKWLQVEERTILIGLWRWYKQGFHFVDSYLLSWKKEHAGKVLTFDTEMEGAV